MHTFMADAGQLLRSYAAGEEVLLCYGEHTNLELLGAFSIVMNLRHRE